VRHKTKLILNSERLLEEIFTCHTYHTGCKAKISHRRLQWSYVVFCSYPVFTTYFVEVSCPSTIIDQPSVYLYFHYTSITQESSKTNVAPCFVVLFRYSMGAGLELTKQRTTHSPSYKRTSHSVKRQIVGILWHSEIHCHQLVLNPLYFRPI
jgi:hypothetical protein